MVMTEPQSAIAVLGASGLIGQAVALWLSRMGFRIVPIARRFSPAQLHAFGTAAIECPFVSADSHILDRIFAENKVDIVINCVGVLQDRHRDRTEAVHRALVERLLRLLGSRDEPMLLIHFSIPGDNGNDPTSFSRTKREAERMITAGSVPFVVLRPGFVVAPSAYGGSALIRALAMLPLRLPPREAAPAFAATDVDDIARTIAIVARRWRDGQRDCNAVWDVMERRPSTAGDVVAAFRDHFGGPRQRIPLPSWLMGFGARAGDLAAYFGWSPPIRTTALREMRRGVAGNPDAWIAATGIEPASLDSMMERLPSTIQERWFARLYLAKPLILGSLVVFWTASGLIALAACGAATAILTSHGFPPIPARTIAIASSLVDIAVGLAVAFRSTCLAGLLAGICVSLFYMLGAAVLTPEMWIEPLGALVKTGPAIVLMVVALAMLESR
jgi:nucleoside-diphosphate-sugar epimerase